MGKSEFTLQGDLSSDMMALLRTFLKETEKFMRRQAQEFRNFARSRAKAEVGKRTGNYLRGFAAGKAVYDWNDAEYNVRVYNRSPHNHLIELGHELVGHRPNKVRIGRVKAFEVMSRAMESWRGQFEAAVEDDLAEFIMKELEK